MNPVVGIIAQGQMGGAVGARLTENGLTVVTALEGRSAASVARAQAARMTPVTLEEFCSADIILSIVPPGEAENLARRLAPHLIAARRKPVYVDCNAVNPETAMRIGTIIEPTRSAYVDAGIIGGPPKAGASGPVFYLSGAQSHVVAELNRFGLECKILAGGAGAASALKMSYGGITKGLTALAGIMILAATRAGTADALRQELALSQPQLLAWFERQVPSMFGKAYRWVAEMEEVAGFVERDAAGHALFESTAELYGRLAADFAGAKIETGALEAFFRQPK
jgi:3-hydroxyisobutyrate dehydrogenase-like beta-hydroxyacid dehydrogenase